MDGKNRELTPEEEAAELAKPGSHPEWETTCRPPFKRT